MKAIEAFQGRYRFLSNFWPAKVKLDGIEYDTVEHAYQAAKTVDPVWREMVQRASTPGIAKRIGRELFVRPDWNSVRVSIMQQLLRQKFAAGTALAQQLLDTGVDELIEGNPWGDQFWGVSKGKGLNTLGMLLMQIRSELAQRSLSTEQWAL